MAVKWWTSFVPLHGYYKGFEFAQPGNICFADLKRYQFKPISSYVWAPSRIPWLLFVDMLTSLYSDLQLALSL